MRTIFNTLRAEAESTIRTLYALEQFQVLCENRQYVARMNQNAIFWLLFQNALAVKLFIGIRRLFETKKDTFNFQNVIDLMKARIIEFSPESIERRKVAQYPVRPQWIDKFMAGVYTPTEEDFDRLGQLVRPYRKKMVGVYTAIASQVFAHAVHTNDVVINSLFEKTNFREIEAALNSVWHFYDQIWQIYDNGKEPSLLVLKYPYADEVRNSVTKQFGVEA